MSHNPLHASGEVMRAHNADGNSSNGGNDSNGASVSDFTSQISPALAQSLAQSKVVDHTLFESMHWRVRIKLLDYLHCFKPTHALPHFAVHQYKGVRTACTVLSPLRAQKPHPTPCRTLSQAPGTFDSVTRG